MSYVDAFYNKEKDLIHVVERVNGERKYRDLPAKYIFYYQDPKGKYTSIYGEPLSRVAVNTNKAFEKEKDDNSIISIWKDTNPRSSAQIATNSSISSLYPTYILSEINGLQVANFKKSSKSASVLV